MSSQFDPEPKQVQKRFLKFKFNLFATVAVNINNETFYHKSSIQIFYFTMIRRDCAKVSMQQRRWNKKLCILIHWVQVFSQASEVQQEIELGILKWIRCWKLFPGREFRMGVANKTNKHKNSICSLASNLSVETNQAFSINIFAQAIVFMLLALFARLVFALTKIRSSFDIFCMLFSLIASILLCSLPRLISNFDDYLLGLPEIVFQYNLRTNLISLISFNILCYCLLWTNSQQMFMFNINKQLVVASIS